MRSDSSEKMKIEFCCQLASTLPNVRHYQSFILLSRNEKGFMGTAGHDLNKIDPIQVGWQMKCILTLRINPAMTLLNARRSRNKK